MNIFITGITGFIGSAVFSALADHNNHTVYGACRSLPQNSNIPRGNLVQINDLERLENMTEVLTSIDVVIHTAARVHVMMETSSDPSEEYRKINVEGTLNLARQAAAAKVKRFIFLSTIKVNGEETLENQPFTALSPSSPQDPYAESKFQAERQLYELAQKSSIEIVIVRLPLVYGPGVKGNLQRLLKFVKNGIPLPLASIRNKRSLLAIGNLIDFLSTCIEHPAAANNTFLLADGEDLSTPELIIRLARAMNVPARLFPLPPAILEALAFASGKKEIIRRLCANLQVDISKSRTLLDWNPVITVDQGLRSMVEKDGL